MKNQAIVRAFQYSLADFQKQDGRQIGFFKIFYLIFSPTPFLPVLSPQFLIFQEK